MTSGIEKEERTIEGVPEICEMLSTVGGTTLNAAAPDYHPYFFRSSLPPATPPKDHIDAPQPLLVPKDKPLPPPPGAEAMITETRQRRDEHGAQSSYMEWSSGSEDGDEATTDYLRNQPRAAQDALHISPAAHPRSRAPTLPPSTTSEHISVRSRTASVPDTQDHSQSFTMNLPDPNLFPDPYPFRHHHPHHLASPPALSSAGSSSTRSSAYASSGSAIISGDYNHVHVASADDERNPSLGLNPDSFALPTKEDPAPPRLRTSTHKPAPHDQGRWSESYTSSRSRSSSIGNNSSHGHDTSPLKLKERPSYETGWAVDEKDEVGLSDDETDDDQPLIDDHDDAALDDPGEERTSAAVIADEGRGLIIQAAETPVVQLQVQPGTTHLLIGSSTTPNAVPAFLTNTLPQICHSLLALDISANFLGALPPVLVVCVNLEELNVASNPLRVLPVFLAELRSLRVLIADSTGISTLPDALMELDKLHTISIRRNKLHALPSWLCMLPALQTLCVDNNPFQGPWNALVEPLLAKTPMTPIYPPSTPVFPLPSASIKSLTCDNEADGTDTEDLSDTESRQIQERAFPSPEDEDQTITPDRAPHLGRSVTSPLLGAISGAGSNVPQSLSRTRTTPNRAYFEQARARPGTSSGPSRGTNAASIGRQPSEAALATGDRELRKMKSAGELRRGKSSTNLQDDKQIPLPNAKAFSVVQSNVDLPNPTPSPPLLPISKRYGSLGPASSLGPALRTNNMNAMRPQLSKSLWDTPSESMAESPVSQNRVSLAPSPMVTSQAPSQASKLPGREIKDGKGSHRPRLSKDGKEKGGRWGFLKKMSMGRMRVEHPPPLPTHNLHGIPSIPERFSKTPQIDLRLSTTGSLDAIIPPGTPPQTHKEPSSDLVKGSPSIASTTTLVSTTTMVSSGTHSLLVPPTQTSRTGKRRSFLPIDGMGGLSINFNAGAGAQGGGDGALQKLNIPIPDNSAFVSGLTASGDFDEGEARVPTPSLRVDTEQVQRREEERAKEAYMRALRSVMAYLKDMNDLNTSQQANPLSVYGHIQVQGRPPTIVDTQVQGQGYSPQLQREASVGSNGTTTPSSVSSAVTEGPGQLRPSETIQRLRNGTTSQTMSIATTDSASSSEERKYKDDKSKRAMVIKEIVLTERTYVKGLQELVDIYIKSGSVPVNILSGSSKETVVPMSERKVVFGGIESLFSFHNESFLPALEAAAAPIMQSPEKLLEADADGQLSIKVAKAVGEIFVKHAAFMKMYSSYINNFDNSVQRVKYWSLDKHTVGTTPSNTVSPTSSTVQLASLALSMSVMPNVVPDSASSGLPNLSTSQRKRLKTYLKRCRMNPRHTQLNLEGYLLLPVQRIPRYRLLLEELLRNTPPLYDYMEDPLDRALAEISSLANNMNEGKRDAESRQKLVQWQLRIRGKFPSPLVQPHRRLIMDGPLLLTRVVRKAVVSFDTINSQGDSSTVQVDCLAPELTPRPLIGILCNDLLVLCRDPSNGQDPNSQVDLWAVLRMQTLPQPASITHGNSLRLVDNKAILYFDAPSPSDALNWYRAINLHIPASKT